MTALSLTVSSSNRGLAGGGGGRGSCGGVDAGVSGGGVVATGGVVEGDDVAGAFVCAGAPAGTGSGTGGAVVTRGADAAGAGELALGALRLSADLVGEFDAAAGAFTEGSALVATGAPLAGADGSAGLAGGSTATDVPITAGGTGACTTAASAAAGRFAALIRRAMKLPAPAATTVATPRAVTTNDLVDITSDLGASPVPYTRTLVLGRLLAPESPEDTGASPIGHNRAGVR
jgi:hypothetical protein